jgi:phage-related protein
MPSLIDSVGNFVSSIFGAITAVLSSILAVFQSLVSAIWGIITTAFAAVGTMVSGLAQTFEGLVKFLLSKLRLPSAGLNTNTATATAGNIVVIGGIVAALFVYGAYQQRNGRPITAAPAKNKKVN